MHVQIVLWEWVNVNKEKKEKYCCILLLSCCLCCLCCLVVSAEQTQWSALHATFKYTKILYFFVYICLSVVSVVSKTQVYFSDILFWKPQYKCYVTGTHTNVSFCLLVLFFCLANHYECIKFHILLNKVFWIASFLD